MEYMTYAWWVIGFIALLVVADWRMAVKKKGHLDPVDRRRLRGVVGIGAVLTAIAWFVEWAS